MSKIESSAFWKAGGGVLGLFAVTAILIAVNVITGNMRLRSDLTDEKLYSLSEGTRSILKKLDRVIVLKLYFNSSDPEVPFFLKNYARQVEDLLKEYKVAGGGNIVLEKYDPKPDSDAEDWARRYEIPGQSMGMMGPPVYFGLVAVAGTEYETMPALDPRAESLLEYNITRLIYRVIHPQKPVIGVLSSLPVLGSESSEFPMPGQPAPPTQTPWLAFEELKGDYSVRQIAVSADRIEEDVDVLIVVHPKDLSDKTLYAIDQFVLRGGRLLAFVDPLSAADMESEPRSPFGGGPSASSDMKKLFQTWGIGFDPQNVIADPMAASRIRVADNRIEDSPVWLSLLSTNFNRADTLTSQLDTMLMAFAGKFSDETSGGVVVSPLLTTSDKAGAVNAMTAQFGNAAVRREFKTSGLPLNLAVRLSGKFETAFPDGRPKDEGAEEKPKPGAESGETHQSDDGGLKEGNSTVILAADVDMLADRFCVQELNFFGFKAHQPVNDNINFLANAVELLAGGTDLIAIRSRGKFNRPFDRVQILEEKARDEWQAKEEELTGNLRETQQQLSEMQAQKDDSQRFILSPDQEKAIARFKQEEKDIRAKLKEVRKNLRKDIERLGAQVKVINIALMPLLVSIAGVCFGIHRRRKR